MKTAIARNLLPSAMRRWMEERHVGNCRWNQNEKDKA
jgi:hypothetical protein